MTSSTIETACKLLLPSIPVPYTPTPGVLVNSRDGKGGSLSLTLHLIPPVNFLQVLMWITQSESEIGDVGGSG